MCPVHIPNTLATYTSTLNFHPQDIQLNLFFWFYRNGMYNTQTRARAHSHTHSHRIFSVSAAASFYPILLDRITSFHIYLGTSFFPYLGPSLSSACFPQTASVPYFSFAILRLRFSCPYKITYGTIIVNV